MPSFLFVPITLPTWEWIIVVVFTALIMGIPAELERRKVRRLVESALRYSNETMTNASRALSLCEEAERAKTNFDILVETEKCRGATTH